MKTARNCFNCNLFLFTIGVPEKKILFCPIKEGKKRYVKNMKIPNFLPKVNLLNNFDLNIVPIDFQFNLLHNGSAG